MLQPTGSLAPSAAADATLWAPQGGTLRDPLTGLATRALFLDRLKHALQRRRRTKSLFAVLVLVPDGMRELRAGLSATESAKLLEMLASRIQASVRDSDTVAGPGGGGFMILLDPISAPTDASFVANRIQQAVEAPLEVDGRAVRVSVRIGVALVDESYTHPLDLVRDAHAALGGVSLAARAHYRLFDPSVQTVTTPELGAELERALGQGELYAVYTPIVRVADGATFGSEAAARWDHPRYGTLTPAQFIGAAEDAGLAGRVEEWLIRQACTAARSRAGSAARVLVRVSGARFRDPVLVPDVEAALHTTGFEAGRLCIAVPESVLMETGKPALEVLQALADAGVTLCIDDFGMGYFTLVHLHRFPIRLLRIDPAFVGGLGVYEENEAIVRATVALARSLGVEAIAAGVETADQLRALREMECSYAQGVAVADPLDPAGADRRLPAP